MRAFLAIGFGLAACGGSVIGDDGGGGTDGSTADAAKDGPTGGGCTCQTGRMCCNAKCVNTDNDPQNCGGCGLICSGTTPYCDGVCKVSPCMPRCMQGQICCKDEGPVSTGAMCFTPTVQEPTCPQGCAPLCQSDRNIKHDITAVSGKDVVETLARIPMSTWSYDGEQTRHMGPMAQDFHGAFGLGNTERAYDPIDAHGVAFAGIQGLYEMVQEQNARLDKLEKENADLKRRCGGSGSP